MSRRVLVAVGVLVLGAGIALVLLLKSGERAHGTQTSGTPSGVGGTDPGATGGAGGRPTLPGEPGGSGVTTQPGGSAGSGSSGPAKVSVTERPRGEGGDPTGSGGVPGASGSGPVQDYVVGGVRVRDHRGSNAAPIDLPPQTHAPGGPRIESTSTNLIGQKVRTALYLCVKDTPREGRGEHPRFEGQVLVDIKAEQASVQDLVLFVRDVPEAVAATITECMRPKLLGQSAPARGEADVSGYAINMQFTIP